MSRDQLFDAMVNGRSVAYNGHWWKIMKIEMEDGSGYSFNLTLDRYDGENIRVYKYVRCPRPAPLKIV